MLELWLEPCGQDPGRQSRRGRFGIFSPKGRRARSCLRTDRAVESLHGGFPLNQDGDSTNGESTDDVSIGGFVLRDSFWDFVEFDTFGLERFEEPFLPRWPIDPDEPLTTKLPVKDGFLTMESFWCEGALPHLFDVAIELRDGEKVLATRHFEARVVELGEDGAVIGHKHGGLCGIQPPDAK